MNQFFNTMPEDSFGIPTDVMIIQGLQLFEYEEPPTSSSSPVGEIPDRCIICMDSFERDELLHLLKCNHYFHAKCIRRWLKKNNTCPHCKRIVT
jgi:hypothetical protein